MNPQFPPTIIGSAVFYNYINENIDSENSLIFDAGNFFHGHPISEIDRGRTIIEYMNYVEGIDDIYQLLEIEEIDSQDILILKKNGLKKLPA